MDQEKSLQLLRDIKNLDDYRDFSLTGLDESINLNLGDEHGRTVLHHAVSRGANIMVRCLLEAGANPNVQDKMGDTPLHTAAATFKRVVDDGIRETQEVNPLVVKELVKDKSLDLSLINQYGETAFDFAFHPKYMEPCKQSEGSASCDKYFGYYMDIINMLLQHPNAAPDKDYILGRIMHLMHYRRHERRLLPSQCCELLSYVTLNNKEPVLFNYLLQYRDKRILKSLVLSELDINGNQDTYVEAAMGLIGLEKARSLIEELSNLQVSLTEAGPLDEEVKQELEQNPISKLQLTQ